jgi:hypothetical protein
LTLPGSGGVTALQSLRDLRSDGVQVDRFDRVLKNGGRYRASNDSSVGTAEETLHFHDLDTVFDTLGPLAAGADQQVAANDYVVVHNLGIAGANAYDVSATQTGRRRREPREGRAAG